MTDTTFRARYWNATTGAQVTGIVVLADHYSGSPSTLVTADLATTDTTAGFEIELDIDTTVPHVVRFHTADGTVAQQVIYTDYAPDAATVDLDPVLDAIDALPTAAENAAANWTATVRTLTTVTGITVVAVVNPTNKLITLVRGDTYTDSGDNSLLFPWSGWHATADTVTLTMRHIQTETVKTFPGTVSASRVAMVELLAEDTEELLEGAYRYDVELIEGTDVYTPYIGTVTVLKDATFA